VSVARNATWLAFGQIIMSIASMVLAPILARKLSMEHFGIYKQVDLAAALITPFLIVGFDKSITYYVPRAGSDKRAEISSAYVPIAALAILVVLCAVLIPGPFARIFGSDDRRLVVTTAAAYAIAETMRIVAGRALIAVGRAKYSALLPVFVGIPRTLLLVGSALIWPTLDTVLWLLSVFFYVEITAWTIVLYRTGYLRLGAFRRDVLNRQLRYGGVLAVVAMAQTWAVRIDRYLVSSALPLDRFAVFTNGKTRVPLLPIFSRALGDAVAPRYSKLESENRHREMAELWRKSVDTLLPIGLLASLCLSLTAKWSIPLVYGQAFRESVPIFQVFSLGLFLDSLISVEQILRALTALRFLVVTAFASLGVRILVGLTILHRGGEHMMVNLVVSQILVTLVLFVVRITYIRRKLGVSWGELAPKQGLAITIPLAAIGWLGSQALEAWIPGPVPLVLAAFAALWGALILIALWRQGAIARIIPASIANRGAFRRKP